MIVAVIPCRNEGTTLASVLRRTLSRVDSVVVVDNASTDNTASIVARMMFHSPVALVHCREPGAGAATRMGIRPAIAMGADIIVTLDGDGQHDPLDIPRLVAPLLMNQHNELS